MYCRSQRLPSLNALLPSSALRRCRQGVACSCIAAQWSGFGTTVLVLRKWRVEAASEKSPWAVKCYDFYTDVWVTLQNLKAETSYTYRWES